MSEPMPVQDFRDHVVASLAEQSTLLRTMNERLWGANGQPGAIPYLNTLVVKNREDSDEAIKAVADDLVKLDKTVAITAWKLGTASAAAGAALTFGAEWLAKRLFHINA